MRDGISAFLKPSFQRVETFFDLLFIVHRRRYERKSPGGNPSFLSKARANRGRTERSGETCLLLFLLLLLFLPLLNLTFFSDAAVSWPNVLPNLHRSNPGTCPP